MHNLDGEEVLLNVEETEQKEKITPFSFVDAICHTKNSDLYAENEKQYNAFVINRALSFYPDTVILASVMNKYPDCPKEMQFRFLLETVRKRKRYGGWIKKTTDTDKIDTIKTFYKYSTARAMEVADLLTDADISAMKQRMSTGGVNARSKQKPTGGAQSG